jgi:hypothetical protein
MRQTLLATLCRAVVGVCWVLASSLTAAMAGEQGSVRLPEPVVEGREGDRAFADLTKYYDDHQRPPPVDPAIEELASVDSAKRASAGRYLLALLMQSKADETNGRGNWGRYGWPAWGSNPESDARGFRASLSAKLASQTTAAEALDAAAWLLEEEQQADIQKDGIALLCRIKSREVENVLRRLLREPHPNQAVLVTVLEQVANRKLVALAPEVRRLAIHYRAAVRTAASKTARILAIGDIPAYRPEEAFAPRLDKMLKDTAAMIEGGVPAGAKWHKFTVTYPPSQTGGKPSRWFTYGWLLSEDKETVRLVTWLGGRYGLDKAITKVEPSTLAETAGVLSKIRKTAPTSGFDTDRNMLSPWGSFSGQFEPSYINLPEGLVAAWLYERGEKRVAAELLFPRIEDTDDDRWIGWAVRDMMANGYHKRMLNAFSRERDYDGAIRLAKYLSRSLFDGYTYQVRAKELAAQLAKRGDDFKALRLPTPEEWTELKTKLSRRQQIEYLAARLRLLNCFQWGQPGGVNYNDPQTAKPGWDLAREQMEQVWGNPYVQHASPVVNPYVALDEMNIQVAELPALVPFLADENFMPTFSYWREFHPGRTLHRVNWAVARLVDSVAKHDLARLGTFTGLDETGRRRHLDEIVEWCRRNAKMSERELLFKSLAETWSWHEFKMAADAAVERRLAGTLPILVRRCGDFERCQDAMVELCFRLDSADAAVPARKWLTSKDENTRFWSALILLQHGDQTKPEGLAELEPILAKDEGWHYYPHAIEPLLSTKNDRAVRLACDILKKNGFHCHDLSSGPILQRLFLTGRRECLDYLLVHLESETPSGSASGIYRGKEVERSLVEGDREAFLVAFWRTSNAEYNVLAPVEDRSAQRKQLQNWLKEQYALIQAGRKPGMTVLPLRLRMAQAHFDAP